MTSLKPEAGIVGILLAAGRGSRFDPTGARNKLLAPVNGQAVAVQSAAKLRAVVDHLIIVCKPPAPGSAQAHSLRQVFSDFDALLTECADAHLGMGHSLAHGVAQALQRYSPRAVLVGLADMPFIAHSTLARLTQLELRPETIAAPRFNGQRGHPVLFGAAHFDALMASHGDTGASQLLKLPSVQWLEVDDAGVLRDVDRPEDLAQPSQS